MFQFLYYFQQIVRNMLIMRRLLIGHPAHADMVAQVAMNVLPDMSTELCPLLPISHVVLPLSGSRHCHFVSYHQVAY